MNEEQKAIDAFMNSEEGKEASDPTTIEAPKEVAQYLRNRIWKAFQRGMDAGKRIQLQKDKERLASLL